MKKKITLAGGCFWSIQRALSDEEGVLLTLAGYTGGKEVYPTYEDVLSGKTNHVEAVQLIYDENKISDEELIGLFFKIHNPTTLNRQGADKGNQYRSCIFYQDENQHKTAINMIEKLNNSGRYKNKIVTDVLKAMPFYPAETYHQNYLIKQGGKSTCYLNRSDAEWKEMLPSNMYAILRERKTEVPFLGKYNDFFKDGFYRCQGCGLKLFESWSKFKSDTGWASFEEGVAGHLKIKKDFSLFFIRDEVLCARCCSHLGHVFFDNKTSTGERYCINSLALEFQKKR